MLANLIRMGSITKKPITIPGVWVFNNTLYSPGDNVFRIFFTHEGIAYNTIETEEYFGNLYVYFKSTTGSNIVVYQFGEWVARYSNSINIIDDSAPIEFVEWLTKNAKKI